MISESGRSSMVVLLVEDDADQREIVREALEEDGYSVLVASDAEEALQASDREASSIDLIITDVLMPRMTGPELVKRLSQSRPAIKVLYISGYADDKTASAYGFSGPLLRKPFSLAALARKVREVLDLSEDEAPEE